MRTDAPAHHESDAQATKYTASGASEITAGTRGLLENGEDGR